jgi:hypothetical protein
VQFRREFAQKINAQGALAVVYFDIIETVPALHAPDGVAAIVLLAAKAHGFLWGVTARG